MAEGELPLSRTQLILQHISSIPSFLNQKMQRPLLPLTATAGDAHPIAQNLERLELGKFAVTVAITATLGLLFSNTFPAAEAHYLVILGFMAACTAVWNGILFEKVCLQLLGISVIMVCRPGGVVPPLQLLMGVLVLRRSLSPPLSLSSYQPFIKANLPFV